MAVSYTHLAIGVCVYGDLIEIVGTARLQRDQLFYGRKVDVQDIPVQSHFPYISLSLIHI